ncbi:MAG: helix-turn-helix domain-containing protein [Haliea sp.]|nr:helix-turn-helix domain-containing protein [Haliea sp.]
MSPVDKGYTTSKGNVLALSQAIQSYGISPESILREGGVDIAQIDDNTRISATTMDRMVRLAVEATGDPALGLRFVDFVQPTSYHALGMALLYSSTLRSFCLRLQRYFTVITNMDQIGFVESEGTCLLSFKSLYEYSEPAGRVSSDAWIAYVVKLLRQIYRPDFCPERVALIWSPPQPLRAKYEEIFLCPLDLSVDEGRLYLDAGALDQTLPTANAELARQSDQVVTEFLARMNKPDLPALVHTKLIEFLPSGNCDRERVAASLNMTVRTLHNRLGRSGTSYRELLEETRRELAMEYIEQRRHSISEIAYLLGYADVGNFSRAFRRWVGLSPNNYLKFRC